MRVTVCVCIRDVDPYTEPNAAVTGQVHRTGGLHMPLPDGRTFDAFMAEYQRETERRRRHETNCSVVELEHVPTGHLTWLPEGSIAVLVAKHGSKDLHRLRSALAARDYNSFRDGFGRQLRMLEQLTYARKPFYRSLQEVPVFGEVAYYGKTLSRAFMVHDSLPVNLAFVPYIGGALNHDHFRLTQFTGGEHHRGDGDLEALV